MYICILLSYVYISILLLVEFLKVLWDVWDELVWMCMQAPLAAMCSSAAQVPVSHPARLLSHVPQGWGGYCPMCQPDGIHYPLQMEPTPAGRRKVQYLQLLCPPSIAFWGVHGISVPWWMVAGGCCVAGVDGDVLGMQLQPECCSPWTAVLCWGGTQPPGLLSPRSSPTALFPIKVSR